MKKFLSSKIFLGVVVVGIIVLILCLLFIKEEKVSPIEPIETITPSPSAVVSPSPSITPPVIEEIAGEKVSDAPQQVLESLESQLVEEKGVYYVIPQIKNNTKKQYFDLQVTIVFLDEHREKLGEITVKGDTLDPEKVWQPKIAIPKNITGVRYFNVGQFMGMSRDT